MLGKTYVLLLKDIRTSLEKLSDVFQPVQKFGKFAIVEHRKEVPFRLLNCRENLSMVPTTSEVSYLLFLNKKYCIVSITIGAQQCHLTE